MLTVIMLIVKEQMTSMVWDLTFEKTPSSGARGYTMGPALRDTKKAVRELMSEDHNFDENDNPEMSHKGGECTILGGQSEWQSDATNGVAFDEDSHSLRQITSSSASVIGTLNHAELDNRDSGDPHTQYVLGSELYDGTIESTIEFDDLEGLQEDQDRNGMDDDEVVSQASHLSTTSMHHADGVVDETIPLSSKLDIIYSDTMGGVSTGTVEINYGSTNRFTESAPCSLPSYRQESGNDNPSYYIRADDEDRDNYNPSLILVPLSSDSDGHKLSYTRF